MVPKQMPRPIDAIKAVPAGSITIHNFITRRTAYVDPQQLLSILNAVGRPSKEVPSGVFLGAGASAKPFQPGVGSLAVSDEKTSRGIWCMATGSDFKTSLSHPPMAPRELGVLAASLALAQTDGERIQVRSKLRDKLAEYNEVGDRLSTRYMEQVMGVVEKEVLRANSEKKRMDDEAHFILQRSKGRLAMLDGILQVQVKSIQDGVDAKIKELTENKSLTSPKTIFGYLGASAAMLVSASTAVWEFTSNWALGWRISASSALISIFIAAVAKFRKSVDQKIDSERADLEPKLSAIQNDILKRQDAINGSDREQLLALNMKWNDKVEAFAISCTLHCFEIAMDFFPNYVKEELLGISEKQFDFGDQKERSEALSLLKKALESNGTGGFNLHLND